MEAGLVGNVGGSSACQSSVRCHRPTLGAADRALLTDRRSEHPFGTGTLDCQITVVLAVAVGPAGQGQVLVAGGAAVGPVTTTGIDTGEQGGDSGPRIIPAWALTPPRWQAQT